MRRTAPGAVILLISTVGLLVLSSGGAQAGVRTGAVADDERAVALLAQAAFAASHTSYSGSRVVTSWGEHGTTAVYVDVTHVSGQGALVTMRGGGVAGDTAAFLAAGEGDSPQRPMFGVDSLDLLTESYDVAAGGVGQVAGRTAQIVEILRDGRRAARVWVDEDSGLPMRREIYDSRGALVLASAFIDLVVDDDAFIAHLPPGTPDEREQPMALAQRSELETSGWACPRGAGTLQLVDIERVGSAHALHLSYSDGLSRVSVFEQRGSLADESLADFTPRTLQGATVQVREGMPSYVMWEHDGTVFTVVSDAPMDTIADVVAAYPHGGGEPGFWGRVGDGLARMGAWATPLV